MSHRDANAKNNFLQGRQISIALKNSSSHVIVTILLPLSTLCRLGMALRKNCTTWAGLVCRMPQWLTKSA